MKKLIVGIVLAIFLYYGCQKNNSDEITIHFNLINADSLHIIEPSFSPARPVKNGIFLEKIKGYPESFSKKRVYQFHIQNFLKLSKMFKEDSSYHDFIKETASSSVLNFLEKIYPPPEIDDIVSACWLEDEKGKDIFIFDANNNEDFRDDSLLNFEPFPTDFLPERTENYFLAKNKVIVEVFDGNKVNKLKLPLGFFKLQRPGPQPHGFFSLRSVRMGTLKLENESFSCIIFPTIPDVNFNNMNFLWIDLNHDLKYQMTDFDRQLYQPFTLMGNSYQVKDIDVFGHHLTLKKLDPERVPPIAEGLPCPDFEITFTDSSKFSTSQAKDKYLILDFWMCNNQYCDMMSKNLLKQVSAREKIIWISCPLDSLSYQRMEKRGILLKDDFRHFVAPKDIERIRKLFQTLTMKVLIIVNPQGKIESIENFTQKKTEQMLKQITDAQ